MYALSARVRVNEGFGRRAGGGRVAVTPTLTPTLSRQRERGLLAPSAGSRTAASGLAGAQRSLGWATDWMSPGKVARYLAMASSSVRLNGLTCAPMIGLARPICGLPSVW